MENGHDNRAFSLVEILVSLFIVSLTAVNISGLQKMVGEQNRNNFAHAAVVALVSEKLEEVMRSDDLLHVMALNGVTASYSKRGTVFDLTWRVTLPANVSTTSPIREVALAITWQDATGASQTFTYSEQVSFAMLLKGAGGGGATDTFPETIPNLLATNKVDYFDAKMEYAEGAYIIYDSQLFQATESHSIANSNAPGIAPPIDHTGVVGNGWEKLGRIDDKQLANLFNE